MSNLTNFEPYANSTMSVFFRELDKRFAATGEVCNLRVWHQRFAFDVIGESTFSRRVRLLEGAQDVDACIMPSGGNYPKLTSCGTRIECWHGFGPPETSPIVRFATERAGERNTKSLGDDAQLHDRDFLSRFIEAK